MSINNAMFSDCNQHTIDLMFIPSVLEAANCVNHLFFK